VGEKNFPEFSTAIIILFKKLSQQKVYLIMTFIYQGSFQIIFIKVAGQLVDKVLQMLKDDMQ